ncbi:MAG: DUF1669 domain-containing protein [Sandaracinaceae bacterium]|nr:DUF1669 domain-containing protein [Sandaracinaceae bacterium]
MPMHASFTPRAAHVGLWLAVVTLSACATSGRGALETGTDTESGGSVRLILHEPTGRPAPLDTCELEFCQALLERIEGAEHTIDFAVYGFRNQTVLVQALLAAQRRGVRIRGVVDRDRQGRNYYASTEEVVAALGPDTVRSDYEAELAEAEAELDRGEWDREPQCERPEGFEGPVQCLVYPIGETCLVAAHAAHCELTSEGAIMHNKFFVVDGRYLWTGSTNVSDSCAGGYNANLVTVIDSERVAAWYTEEFEQMYVHGRYHQQKRSRPAMTTRIGDTELEVHFSPQDRPITRRVRRLIRDARERIDVAVFYLTHKGIAQDLIAAHLRGVRVRVLLDATSASNGYTKHELLRAVGIPVIVERWGGKMHMKSAAIDGEWVITGSMNWTSAGEGGNDENTILLRDRAIAAQYHAFFERMWAWQGEQFLTSRPGPESRDSTTACTDGLDNDYNDLTDAEDPGCSENPPPQPRLPGWRIVHMQEGVCQVDDPSPLQVWTDAP